MNPPIFHLAIPIKDMVQAKAFYNLLEFKYYCHAKAIFGGQNVTAVGERE